MPFELDLQHEVLNYRGTYARPILELWGKGGIIIDGLLNTLSPHNVRLPQIQVSANASTAADVVVVAQVPGAGSVKFSFDKLEFNFTNFSQEFFESIPNTMTSLTKWLRAVAVDFKFSSHNFLYSCHSFVKDSTPQNVLETVNPRELKDGGITVGNGAIFNYRIPSKSWETKLLIDKSEHITGGLFVSFELRINSGEIDYREVMLAGRHYLRGILQELNLSLPETQI